MELKKDIILIGGGGHCKNCIEVIEIQGEYNIVGIIDLKQNIGNKILNYYITDSDDNLEKIITQCSTFLITLGYGVIKPNLRQSLFEKVKILGGKFPTIISPYARVSQYSQVNDGTIIMHNSIVNSDSVIGCNCIINSGIIVDHDVIIGDHSIIMSGTVLNGKSVIGDNCYISSNSVALTGTIIENNAHYSSY